MWNEFLELCVFCHYQKYVLSLQDVLRGLSGRLCFQMHVLLLDSSLNIWMIIWDIFHVSVELPHCFRIENPFRFHCNISFSFVIVLCFPMSFFYFFIILLLYFSTTFANSNFSWFLYTAFSPRLKFISVYTVFLCSIKSSDIKQCISSKT